MPDVICNASPLVYLHQLEVLHILRRLASRVVVPHAVSEELRAARAKGHAVPDPKDLDWADIRKPASDAVLSLVRDLGPGETQALALALESPGSVVVIDDRLVRRVAASLLMQTTGTLGLLVDAKRSGLIPAVKPLIARLQDLRFGVAPDTRAAILRLAAEES